MPICVLTLMKDRGVEFTQTDGQIVEYKFEPIGIARFDHQTYTAIHNENKAQPLLAGICRNRFENEEQPILITQEFMDSGTKKLDYPKEFKEKAYHLLKHMYNKGGKDYHDFDFESSIDYPLAYCETAQEFENIMKFFDEKRLAKYTAKPSSGRYFLTMTEKGIAEAEKELPQLPMFGLVNQKITTGDSELDATINHARQLFHTEPQSMDKMRSACESLSFILEPLRKELVSYFSKTDVQDFFNIVNNFDVRHNKDHTKALDHPEQLEWIYYSLLNTINTYIKLKSKLETKDSV